MNNRLTLHIALGMFLGVAAGAISHGVAAGAEAAKIAPLFQLPAEGVAPVLAVDQALDMGRTMTNVVGASIAAAVIARWEGEVGSTRPGVTGSGRACRSCMSLDCQP